MRARSRALVLLGLAAFACVSALAVAQELDPRRPRTLPTGSPSGPSALSRGDPARTGHTDEALPHGALRLAWPRRALNVTVDHAPLVRPDGTIIVITSRGDAHFLDGSDGNELAKVSLTEAPATPPVLLSSGRVAYLATSGRAVVFSQQRVHSTYVVAHDRPARVAPLAMLDGGFVVATASELVLCDSEGRPRQRGKLPSLPTGALLSTGRAVLVVLADGTVLSWTPGDTETTRVGAFEGGLDGNAALSGNLLYGVSRGSQLVALDLSRGGASSVVAAAPLGLFLGPPAVRGDGSISLLQYTATNAIALTLAPDGTEALRSSVGTHPQATLGDGGPAPVVAPAHTGVLVDDDGALAFMTPEGQLGVVSREGVDTLGESACGTSVGRRAVGQLASAGKGAFVVACETGTLVKVTSK